MSPSPSDEARRHRPSRRASRGPCRFSHDLSGKDSIWSATLHHRFIGMSVEFKDYYAILGVDRSADDKTIKSAYRRLARKYHPDVAKGKDADGDRFKEISEAYEVLSDPEKRRRYDTLGPDWQRYAQPGPAGQPGGVRMEYGDAGDFSDFFRTIFGDLGARGAGRSGPRRCRHRPRGSARGRPPRAGRPVGTTSRPASRSRWRTPTTARARPSGSRSRSPARPATAPATSAASRARRATAAAGSSGARTWT